ncbi:MAG TPA: hypothetical protein VEL76_39660 [Gemmataceae bacterium]|nr:hypothetical protein [Gemmataceae bacterium]
MRQSQTTKVSKRKVQELLSAPGCVPETALSAAAGGEVHQLADGRVLLVHKRGTGTLWDRNALLASLRRQPALPQHILTNLLPDGQRFPGRVPALVGRLAALLRLRRGELDGTEDSLRTVDRAIATDFPRWGQRHADLFEALVAYTGEGIRRREPFSRWETQLGWDGRTWEPWIRTPAGVGYAPFEVVYGELFGEPKEFWSLFHAVHLAPGVEADGANRSEPIVGPGGAPR